MGGNSISLLQELDKARSYGDVFTLVKRTVRKSVGQHRVGLMLLLGNLPLRVGAFHPMGTNEIVLNRRLFENTSAPNWREQVFAILLHEYLHTLGYEDEQQVRRMTYRICLDNFGKQSPVVEAAITGPWTNLTEEDFAEIAQELNLELVRDFERFDGHYII
jgi:hypothetical protein